VNASWSTAGQLTAANSARYLDGAALLRGHTYTLLIDSAWHDARGNPLAREFRKTFRVTKADVSQPDPRRWQLTQPRAETRNPLIIDFNEPLDHALLQHAIRVSRENAVVHEGHISVDEREMRWSFRPTTPWIAGSHSLIVDETLEDLAGNSISRPFEVYLPGRRRPAETNRLVVPFQIDSKPSVADTPAK
jgi:hypothetical protein